MRKRQITVAVIDDDPNILGSVRELLNAKGFITEPFASAEGFLASGVIPRVDCLLLDIQLAGASGIDLRHHLEACGSKLPVIFMTASMMRPCIGKHSMQVALRFCISLFRNIN
jgi:FixJ family two-component response regulator